MYETVLHENYWPDMVNNGYTSVVDCYKCACHGANKTRTRHLKLFSVSDLFECIAMDNIGQLPKMTKCDQFVEILTDPYLKLPKAVPTPKASATHIATSFYDSWIIPYGIPVNVLKDNCTQFVSEFFRTICNLLGLKHFTTTAWHTNLRRTGRQKDTIRC